MTDGTSWRQPRSRSAPASAALRTALGILLGLAVGSGIACTICRTMDQPFLQLVRAPSIPAWIAGAVLTVLFTAVVNYVALRPVKNLKLTDLA